MSPSKLSFHHLQNGIAMPLGRGWTGSKRDNMVFSCRLRGGKHSLSSTLLGDVPVSQHSLLQKVSQWKPAGSWEGLAASLRGPPWGKEAWLLYDTDGDGGLTVGALSGWWSVVSFLTTLSGLANCFETDRVQWMKSLLILGGFTSPFAYFPTGSVCH